MRSAAGAPPLFPLTNTDGHRTLADRFERPTQKLSQGPPQSFVVEVDGTRRDSHECSGNKQAAEYSGRVITVTPLSQVVSRDVREDINVSPLDVVRSPVTTFQSTTR